MKIKKAALPCASAMTGFTLLEMSIVLAIIAVILGGSMTIFSAMLQKREFQETQAKLAAIQQALYNFRMANNRLPCPADASQAIDATSNNLFGTEGGAAASCNQGVTPLNFYNKITSPTGNLITGSETITGLSSTAGIAPGWTFSIPGYVTGYGFIVSVDSATQVTISLPPTNTGASAITLYPDAEGMVPTKTLRLPDDYAFDGWGRRILYAVDTGFTVTNAFSSIPASDTTQRMTIDSTTTPTAIQKTNLAAYVLLSFGANGHGAFPRSGGNTRISSGSINVDELANCNCDNNANTISTASGTLTGIFVQKAPTQDPTHTDHTNDFDDIVVYGTRSALRSPLE